MIELKHVEKKYENITPLRDVSTVINKGDVISIIGPSGTGKTTLIRCINMLDPPTAGEILFEGRNIMDPHYDLTELRKKVGMVFQSFNLFGHLTVIENIMMPQIDLLHRSKQEAYDKGIDLLKKVGLAEKEDYYPDQLSGGQKQRVAIARTLSMDPEVVLFDEPTSALDPTMVGEVEQVIKDLAGTGITMMIVTHEMRLAREIANRVFYMDQGEIYEDCTPEQIFDFPQRERTKEFIYKVKVLEICIDSRDFDFQGSIYSIEKFCAEHDLSSRTKLRLISVFEELCKEILLPALPETPAVKIIFTYDNKTEELGLVAVYNGGSFDPLDSGNEISLSILKSHCASVKHDDISDGVYTNRVDMVIRN